MLYEHECTAYRCALLIGRCLVLTVHSLTLSRPLPSSRWSETLTPLSVSAVSGQSVNSKRSSSSYDVSSTPYDIIPDSSLSEILSSIIPPHLWNQLPSSFIHCVHSPPGSPHPTHITSSQSPPSLSSPITASTFHSRLKTHLFHKSFPP